MRSIISRFRWQARAIFALAFTLLLTLASTGQALASVTLVKLSTDPYTNSTSQHQTQVEPDIFSFGSTIVSAFQSGRFPPPGGGSSNIGWATSTNGGGTWTHGFLPGTTVYATPPGSFARVTDPAVVYDAKFKVWLIASQPLYSQSSGGGAAMAVSRSSNGLSWSNPIIVANFGSKVLLDKDWITCDNTPTSPFYGNCYDEFDNGSQSDLILMSTSTNGGLTWGSTKTTANGDHGLGGEPLVESNGTVIVPLEGFGVAAFIVYFASTNGGSSWGPAFILDTIHFHRDAGGIRSGPLPSAAIDGANNVYIAWADCRSIPNCAANQIRIIVFKPGTTSKKVVSTAITVPGTTFSDFFLPGIGVDRSTSGSGAHIGIVFYYYPVSNCTASTCQLNVGFGSSTNGGASFSNLVHLAGPMKLSWLPQSDLGRMVGDYTATTFSGGKPYPVFANATAPSGGTTCGTGGVVCHESMYTAKGLAAGAGSIPSTVGRVVASSDHLGLPSTPVTAH